MLTIPLLVGLDSLQEQAHNLDDMGLIHPPWVTPQESSQMAEQPFRQASP